MDFTYGRDGGFLAPGGVMRVNPDVPIKMIGIRTNRWRDYDLSLFSPELDLERLFREAASPVELLGEEYFQEPRALAIEVREGSETRAVFALEAAFTAADWAVRGDMAAEPTRKVRYYRMALAKALDNSNLDVAHVKSRMVDAMAAAGLDKELAEFWEDELLIARGPGESVEILGRLLALYRKSADSPKEIETLERLLAFELDSGRQGQSAGILARLLGLYQAAEDRPKEIETLERILALRRVSGEPIGPIVGALAMMFRQERPKDSAQYYEELLTVAEPSRLRAYLSELASIYEELGDTAGQISVWERFLDVATPEEVPAVWDRLVNLQGEAADDEGHRAAWAGLAASLPDGPEKANAYRRLGNLWLEAEDRLKAEEAFKEASRLEPDDIPLLLNLARLGAARGDRRAYLENLEKARAAEPSADLTHELAQAYEVDGQKKMAAELWLELAQLPGAGQGAEEIRKEAKARLLSLLRPRRGFSDEYEKRLYEFSDNPIEFYNLGVARFRAKHWAPAEKAFQRASELDRDGGLGSDIRGYLLALYQANGQADKMVVQAMRLYKDNPTKKEYRDLIFNRFETARDWAGLARAAVEWTTWRPEDPDNWRFLALGQRNAGRPQDAAKSLLKVAELERTKVSSWLAAAEALEKSGEREAATSAYKKVVEIDPSNARAESALLRLALDGVAKSRGSGG